MTSPVAMPNRFQRSGDYWIVSYEGRTVHLRATRGMRSIAVLLERPGATVPAIELALRSAENDTIENPAGEGGEATKGLDAARDAELARVNVTRAIRNALRKITQHHPRLAEHLQRTIRTGGKCSYSPDPRVPIEWEL